jgi:hypothetical protein
MPGGLAKKRLWQAAMQGFSKQALLKKPPVNFHS